MSDQPSKQVKLMLGLPVYGAYHPLFVRSLLDLMRRQPQGLHLYPLVGDSLVSRARNNIAHAFLQSDSTHLLFLDTDLIFAPEHIGRLVNHGIPFVTGLYPKKQAELSWVCNTRKDFPPRDPETGLQRILYGGTGCMLIAREVFEAIVEKFGPEISYEPDDGEDGGEKHDFFKVGVYHDPIADKRRYLSEDWYFCQMALDAGYELFADTHVILKHCGEAIYPLQSIEEVMAANEIQPAE